MKQTNTEVLSDGTLETFESSVLQSQEPVLVDFWAPWCGPCRALKPTVEHVAKERGQRTVFVNVDEQPDLAVRYGIQSIPALRVFRDGEVVAARNGALPRADLETWLEESAKNEK